jgi:hypothetical protein
MPVGSAAAVPPSVTSPCGQLRGCVSDGTRRLVAPSRDGRPVHLVSQLQALLLTLAIEVTVGILLLARWGGAVAWRRAALAAAGASLVTHPVAWWANTVGLTAWSFAVRAPVIEIAVVAAEALILRWALPVTARRAAAVSIAMNAASFAVGLMLARA